MKIISAQEVHEALNYPDFVNILKEAYAGSYTMPPRKVFLLEESSHDAFALLPSWNENVIGVKSFTYFPHNEDPYKSLYSKILLFDRKHGEPLALVDGTSVTFFRTAGVSALSSQFLSREDSETLLLLGTGNLARFLIRAHASVRPLQKILLWGRTKANAEAVVTDMQKELPDIEFVVADDIQTTCGQVDIVVAATGSPDILVQGDWIKEGTHTDFLGNHHADKRECDTALVVKSKVYLDTYVNCFNEAGEVLVPIEEGVFKKEDVKGELAELCMAKVKGRESDSEITLFKSVGSALSDLVGANHAFQSLSKSQKVK
ncbi:MAG: ornithine cyclodeaminase family protein [Candidatus Marinimicrobia bacterium]|nr:ornithine cyclodeaminase family protein [Candidatus Neomarinimicrobiota bacterium]